MRKIIFGAGAQGRTAASAYKNSGVKIDCFFDNNPNLQGKTVIGIPVIGINDLLRIKDDSEIIICSDVSKHREMIEQLKQNAVDNYHIFDKELILKKERLVSFSYADQNEDIILYHVLKNRQEIFYIDIGSNDPFIGSVTQLFYERGHNGINIDIEPQLIEITRKIRPRDVSLCVAVGAKDGEATFYHQGEFGGLSTLVKDNVASENQPRKTTVVTLKKICDKYANNRNITFLKIDVEGAEREVLGRKGPRRP